MAIRKNIEWRDHQEKASDKAIERNGNLLLYHGVGTGKTGTSISIMQKMRDKGMATKALVVVPSSLRENFAKDGVNKFTTDSYSILGNKQELSGERKDIKDISKLTPKTSSTYNIVSYDLFKRDPVKYIKNTGADTVIYDELHKAKNESSKITQVIKDVRKHHKNFIGLTGSLTSNSPADMVPLIHAMTDGKHVLGSKESFEGRFLNEDNQGKKTIKNGRVLRMLASPYVDFVDRDALPSHKPPKRVMRHHDITMNPIQSDVYRQAIDKLDIATKAKLKMGMGALSDKQMKSIGNKLMGARQASNGIHVVTDNVSIKESYENSNKAQLLIDNVADHLSKTPDGQVIIGSQFIKGGVDMLEHGLKEKNIPYSVFIGKGNKGVSEKSR